MASRRIAKSAVDWVSLAERVPKNQTELYRAFKAKSDGFVTKVNRLSAEAPKINWDQYRKVVATPGIVDKMQKEYEAFKIPYPQDKDNIVGKVDQEAQEAAKQTAEFVKQCQQNIEEAKGVLSKIDMVPPLEKMTDEVFADYFPDRVPNPQKPTMWPHIKSAQPENIQGVVN